jgi:hypothetical protein
MISAVLRTPTPAAYASPTPLGIQTPLQLLWIPILVEQERLLPVVLKRGA